MFSRKEDVVVCHINSGDRLIHYSSNSKKITGCTVEKIVDNSIVIVLDEVIASKTKLTLPLTHFGEWLFFDKSHISLSSIELYVEYSIFGNKRFKNILKDDNRRLLKCLKEHKFEGFHHYTDFANLEKIFEEGFLYSRKNAAKRGVISCDGAQKEIIERTNVGVKNHVRFYYKECTPTMFVNEGIKRNLLPNSPHMPIPVLLLFDEKLLFCENAKVSDGGCGNSHSKITANFEDALHFAWEDVFSRGPLPSHDDDNYEMLKNRRNAEFLVNEKVSLNHLKKIIFRSNADKKHADSILKNNHVYQKTDKYVDIKKFNVSSGKITHEDDERNYLKDYTLAVKNGNYIVRLDFYGDTSEYSHKLVIYHNNGKKYYKNICCTGKKVEFSVGALNGVLKMEYLMNDIICAVWERKL